MLLGSLKKLGISYDFDVGDLAVPGRQISIKRAPFYTDILTARPNQNFNEMYQASVRVAHREAKSSE